MTAMTASKHEQGTDAATKAPFMNGKKPLNIVIIGGSCAGLMSGILLKRGGHNVRILESAASSEREGLAAGIGLAPGVRKFFDKNDRLKHEPFSHLNQNIDVFGKDLEVIRRIPIGLSMTTWDATYYRLRANFDALKSPYCKKPPPVDPKEGKGIFLTGKHVEDVEEIGGGLRVTAKDFETHELDSYDADVVIAADGANSSMRRMLEPSIQREEPGYVLWRGTIPTKDVPRGFLERIENRCILNPMRYSYSIIYTIPGDNGSLADGERHINWAWYNWVPRSEVSSILTDIDGHEHRTTLPKGKMKPEIWQRQIQLAKRMMQPEMVELMEKIKNPFVSIISSIASPRAAYFNNRLFLIGDALSQKQPNTGQGTNLAATDATSLVSMIAGDISPAEWEAQVVKASQRERLKSVAFASGWMCTYFGMWWAELRYRLLLREQGVASWWTKSSAMLASP